MIWTEESAAWLARAYRCGGAARALADRIAPYLAPGAHVCDAGCGVGALSQELARSGMRVTALDIDALALDQLHAGGNIQVLQADAWTHVPEVPYDAMIFCFFGTIREALALAAGCCTGDVCYISRDYDMHRFSVGAHPVRYSGYRDALRELDALQIPYDAAAFELDMGQPFESLEEARRFYTLYTRDDPAMITDEFLTGKLIRTRDKKYPLYLPHMRRAGMVHFRVKDIPQPARIFRK